MANDYVDKITLQNGNVYDIKGGTKLYKHVVSVGQNYEEYAFEFISTDAIAYTSSTFNYSGLFGKVVSFIPKSYAGGGKIVLGISQGTGQYGEIIFLSTNNSTVEKYALGSLNIRSDTVTEL